MADSLARSGDAATAAGRAVAPRVPAVENQWLSLAHRIWRNPLGKIGFTSLVVLIVVAAIAPVAAPYSPYAQHSRQELLGPNPAFWFGTDELGRDILSRLMWGTRISLLVGIVSVAVGISVGVTSGMVAGYAGGLLETIIMRVWDSLLAFPAILLGIAVAAMLGPGVVNAAIAVGIVNIPQFSRISRASMLSEKERDYVLAARTVGQTDAKIVFRHVLPNITTPLIIQATLAMAYAVLLEAGLSFLGIGAQPPEPSWGSMLNASRGYLRDNAWYGIFPGIALSSLLLGLNFMADAVRDALDPRQKHLFR
ncbi:MAG: ABC transporter permease [Chloroflexota bacterium]